MNTSQPGVGLVLLFTSDWAAEDWGIEAYITASNISHKHSQRFNKVVFENRIYSTITDVPVSSNYYNSQTYFAKVPERWNLVHNLSTATALATIFNFGAEMVIIGNGTAIMTSGQDVLIDDNPPSNELGSVFSQTALLEEQGGYRCVITSRYFCQILIVLDDNADDDVHNNDDGDNGSTGGLMDYMDNSFAKFRDVAIIMIVFFIVISTLIYL